MFYPGCPLCVGAVAALLSLVIGPAGAAAARKDPLCLGLFFVWLPLSGLQAVGHLASEQWLVHFLNLDQLFLPAWLHALLGSLFATRVFFAWRQGKVDAISAAAKAAADEMQKVA